VARADAPGRVNLIGEHTDYNDGFVLPATIPQRTAVELDAREDDRVLVSSDGFGTVAYMLRREERANDWGDYLRGVTWALADAGHAVRGFDARITSAVPPGAGLASSAALEVALLRALRTTFELPLSDAALALIAHRAEREFVGAHVGTMDQLAASMGVDGEALFIDTRSGMIERIALPRSLALIVIDSGTRHDHARGAYNTRREECEHAARLIGVRALRDATERDAAALEHEHPLLAQRARHVIGENARVPAFVTALRSGDAAACGRLLDESHRSLRDDFAVSTPEIDTLVALLRGQPGVYGARIVGGGFGGSVLAVATPASAPQAARVAADTFRAQLPNDAKVVLS
jgi:galactokinase